MDTRIQKYAKFFTVLFWIALFLLPLWNATIWLSGGAISGPYNSLEVLTGNNMLETAYHPTFPLPWDIRTFGLGVSMIPTTISMLSLWWLIRLFSYFIHGEIFTCHTVKYIRRLGWTMFSGVLLTPVHEALLTIVLTLHNAPGKRLVRISFESADVKQLITAGLIILISWIMNEGRKLRETNELTI